MASSEDAYENRLAMAFNIAMSRAPSLLEMERLTAYLDKVLDDFRQKPDAAKALLGVSLRRVGAFWWLAIFSTRRD